MGPPALSPATPSAGVRRPPTGPKALRTPSLQPTASSSSIGSNSSNLGSSDRISISFPGALNAAAGPSGTQTPGQLGVASPHQVGAGYGYAGDRARLLGMAVRPPKRPRQVNGFGHPGAPEIQYLSGSAATQLYGISSPAGPQAMSTPDLASRLGPRSNGVSGHVVIPPRGPQGTRVPAPPPRSEAPSKPPPPPPPPEEDIPPPPRRKSKSRSRSPRKKQGDPPARRLSSKDSNGVFAQFLPTDESARTPISISLQNLPNGKVRSRPPHLENRSGGRKDLPDEGEEEGLASLERRVSRTVPPPPPSEPPMTPPPPGDRPPSPPPPTPPLRPGRVISLPPPPPDDSPPSPPPQRVFILPPPPPKSATASYSSPPLRGDEYKPSVSRRSSLSRPETPPPPPPPAEPATPPPPPPPPRSRLASGSSPPSPPVGRPPRSPSPLRRGRSRSPSPIHSKLPHRGTALQDPAQAPIVPPKLPPAFHFRELVSRRSPSPDGDEADGEDEGIESGSGSDTEDPVPRLRLDRDMAPHLALKSARPPSPLARSRPTSPPTPPPPPRDPTPPPPPKEWVAPECVFNREAGSFYATFSADGRKEVSRRLDGKENGQYIRVQDPRLAMTQQDRSTGTGNMKQRAAYKELEYTWDDNSVGPKPPSPPTAVLITGLSFLTTAERIRTFLRPYGRIRELDAKMDPKSGMQLGICWVNFDGPPSGKTGMTAHDVAVQVIKACNGQRIGTQVDEKVIIVLDGRGSKAEKAVKEELLRKYPPKVPPPVSAPSVPAPPVSAQAAATKAPTPIGRPHVSTPSSSGHATPLHAPTAIAPAPASGERKLPVPVPVKFHGTAFRLPVRPGLQPSGPQQPVRQYPIPSRFGGTIPARPMPSFPGRPGAWPVRPAAATQQLASSFTDAPFAERPHHDDRRNDRFAGKDHVRGRLMDRFAHSRSTSFSRSRSRSRSRLSHPSSCSTCSSDSEDDRRPYRRGAAQRSRGFAGPGKAGEAVRAEDDEKTKKVLSDNAKPVLFIDRSNLGVTPANEIYLKDHFKKFKPDQIIRAPTGFYILFQAYTGAQDAKFLDGSALHGIRISLTLKTDWAKAPEGMAQGLGAGSTSPILDRGPKSWQMMTIGKKNRAVAARQPSPKKVVPDRKKRVIDSDSEDEVPLKAPISRSSKQRSPSPSSSSELSEVDDLAVQPPASKRSRDSLASEDEASTTVPTAQTPSVILAEEGESEVEKEDISAAPVKPGKKRPGPKQKGPQKTKKARIASPAPLVEPQVVPEAEVAEIRLDTLPEALKPAKAKVIKPKKVPLGPLDKLIADGVIEDEEDAYWLSQALAAGEGDEPDFSDDEEQLNPFNEEHPLHHIAGAWRAEGLRKVPHALKSSYLPQRNRAQAAAEASAATGSQPHGLTTGRTARVTGRRLALDMETHRKTVTSTADVDLFAFNQLRIRKKQLRFARSAIEGYGLYAMETIQPGEMVCEYVGELCRSAVADLREARYLKQGIGSSYLFRIDGDVVCDATFRGSVSRLINHSCDPSASAKIISINGQSKIVIYAKRLLLPGDEILYDYKFPLEPDPALRVPCLCGSKICRGFLN